jgi:ribosomal protein S28E/S33
MWTTKMIIGWKTSQRIIRKIVGAVKINDAMLLMNAERYLSVCSA